MDLQNGGNEASQPIESNVSNVSTTSQSIESQPSSSGSQASGFAPPPSTEPRIAASHAPRNQNGQFASPQPQPQFGQFGGQAGGQFAGQSPGVLAALKAAGYDTSGFSDDSTFFAALKQQSEAVANYQKQVADYQRQLAARQQPVPGGFERVQEHLAAPAEQAPPGWNPPAYDTRNDQFFQFDEQTQRWVPNRPNVPYELVQAKNDYMDYRAAFVKEWSDNPIDTIWKRTEARNRELVREELRQLFDTMKATKDTNDWLERNKSVLYVDGQVDHTGDPNKLTAAGQLAVEANDLLDRAGVFDAEPRRLWTEKYIAAELAKQYLEEQNDPAKRRYTVEEIQQAIQAAVQAQMNAASQQVPAPEQGVPPTNAPDAVQQAFGLHAGPRFMGGAPEGWQMPQAPAQPQSQSQQAAPQQFAQQQFATPQMPQQQPLQPYLMTPQGPVWNPAYVAAMQQSGMQPQFTNQVPVPYQQQASFVPQQGFAPQQGFTQQQWAQAPDQGNASQQRRFVGGVGHSSSAGPTSVSGEFAPQPSPNGKPSFMNTLNQLAAARGISL